MKIFIHKLNSCGMRNVEISRYCDFFRENGYEIVNSALESDYILIWTCSFRSDVRDNSILEVIRYIKEYGEEKVIVAGCLPDSNRQLLRKYFQGKIINWRDDESKLLEAFGPQKRKLSEIPQILVKKQLYENEIIFRKENPNADVPYIGRFIQLCISAGCKFNCTYCSEKLAFPPYQSFPENEIIKQCREEVERSGKTNIVLLADDVGDYGCDIGTTLINLIYHLQDIGPNLHFALQGLNPYHFIKFYDDMIKFLSNGIIIHLQIPFQSASDHILRLMERPYIRVDIDKIFNTINQIGFKEFDTHIIVGFPGETDEDFEESMQFVLRHRPKYVLINSFMEAPEMRAVKLSGKISPDIIYQRVMKAALGFISAGIICNYDNSDLSQSRFGRLNKEIRIGKST